MTSPQPGQAAPDFTLPAHDGSTVSLTELRGAPAVLVFYPFAFSGICTGELCELRDNLDGFTADGVRVLAISCDPVHSLRAFAEHERYPFPLLSDFWPHGEVARAYGVFDAERGRAERGSFLLDADGVVRWQVVNHPGQGRSLAEYRAAVSRL